jgi:hypothetical protein
MPNWSEGASQARIFRQRSQSAAIGRQQSATVGLEHRDTKVCSGEHASVYNQSTVACVNKKHHSAAAGLLSPKAAIIRRRVLAELGHSPFQNSWLLKFNLMVSADGEPTSASRIRRSSEFIVELSPCRTPC